MRLLTVAWRNLARRRLRTALTLTGLAIMTAAVTALLGVADGFARTWVDLYNNRQLDIIVQRSGGGDAINRMLNYDLRERLMALPGVHEVLASQLDLVSLPEFDMPTVMAIGWEPDTRLLRRLHFTAGRSLKPGDGRVAIIGETLAANTHLKPHDSLQLYGERVEIIGVFQGPNTFENGAAILPLAALQELMDTKMVTAFTLSVDHPEQPGAINAVVQEIKKLDPALMPLPVVEFVGSIRELALARSVAWAISTIALAIGVIGMLNTMVMSVAERISEIGALRAIGWKKWRVVTVILYESLLLSLFGGAAGVLAAFALTGLLSRLPVTSGVIQGGIAPGIVTEGLLVAIVVGLGGGLYPAWWAARLAPIKAMRRR